MNQLIAIVLCLLVSLKAQANEPANSNEFYNNKILSETKTLAQGQYEIGGSFSLNTTTSSSYSVSAEAAYFYKDDLSILSKLGFDKDSIQNTTSIGAGLAYYFAKTETFAPYVSQVIELQYEDSETDFFGDTSLGVLFMIAPRIGFKTFSNFSYSTDSISAATFSVMGQFSIFLK